MGLNLKEVVYADFLKAILLSLFYGLLVVVPANFTIFQASNFSLLWISYCVFAITA
jgi:hypothetical protein